MNSNHSKLDEYRTQIEQLRNVQGYSNSEIVRELKLAYGIDTSEKSIRRAFKRWMKKETGASVKILGNLAEIVTPSTRLVTDPEELMRELGVAPEDWEVSSIIVNRWGDVNDPQYQLKASLKNKKDLINDLILPASDISYSHDGTFKEPKVGENVLGFFASDFHEPFHEPKLFRAFLNWLNHNEPHEGVIGGDLMDFPEQSRHRHKPEWKAKARKCVNAGYLALLDIRTASEKTKLIFLPGNHDERIRNSIIDHNKDLFDLRPADKPGQSNARSVWDLRSLLHLDELGVTYIDPEGTYEYACYEVSSELGASHGWLVSGQSGKSAANHLDTLGHSVIHGHTHRLGFHYRTFYTPGGEPKLLQAVEAGCMCQMKKGLGYKRAANWQQAFVTYTITPEGYCHIEPAVFINDKLYWRNQVY